nr:MAG TPA: major capsid protein [Crassvirales sp.]
MYKMRILSQGKFEDRGYSNEESIAYLQLQKPVEINAFLTYNYGMDDDRFPLSFMTEGQGSSGTVDIATVQWTWSTMGRMKFTDFVTYFNAANTKPGLGGAEFEVHFSTHWFIEQYGLIAPDGKTQVRVQKDLGESAHGYGYILKLTSPNPNAFVDPEMLAKGKYWSMSAPTVSESYSKGNRSNSMGPGKMTSQLEFQRYSKEIAGNLANVITEYEFKTKGGGTSKLWINEEMRQFNLNMRVMNEERLWMAEYNRNSNGEVLLKDRDNGKPIPHTSGMLEICRESNYDTYGEYLPLTKIKRTVGDVLDRDTDTGTMDIVLMGGKGFLEDFDESMKIDAKENGFLTPLGDKEIQGSGNGLEYGAYFRKYKTVDGHTITAKHCSFFDKGTIAEAAKQNGMIHPRSGLPITSHQACFIDFSSYEGHRNVRMVRQQGQIHKAKVIEGMTDIPACWGLPNTNHAATEVDMARYEVKSSLGLQVDNSNKMFLLKCVL